MSSAKFEPRISAVQSALVSKPRDEALGTFAAALYLFSIGLIAGGIVLAPADQPTRWFDEKQTLTSYSGTKILANASFLLACFAAVLDYYRQLEIRLTSVRVAEQLHQTSGADAA